MGFKPHIAVIIILIHYISNIYYTHKAQSHQVENILLDGVSNNNFGFFWY